MAAVVDLGERAPNVADFLSGMQVPNAEISAVLALGDDNKASPGEVAAYFLENYEDIGTKWVPANVAGPVKGSL